jgi:hypothetical protein
MERYGPGNGYKKFALAVSGVGLLLAVACGTSSAPVAPPAGKASPTGSSANNEPALPGSPLTEPAAPADSAESADAEPGRETFTTHTIGNNVGDRIPDFAITLVDGSTVTAAELLAQKQPTFLFFFETW